jgi:hypothetical protein
LGREKCSDGSLQVKTASGIAATAGLNKGSYAGERPESACAKGPDGENLIGPAQVAENAEDVAEKIFSIKMGKIYGS